MAPIVARLVIFRKEVAVLWRAFFRPETPLYLKSAMVATLIYLISPIDFIPEIIPGVGFLDDLIIVPLMVRWIVGRLPQPAQAETQPHSKTIDGTARRK